MRTQVKDLETRVDSPNCGALPVTTASAVAPNRHVWKSRAYGWVARVLHDDGAISFWSCDTEAEAMDAVARGLRAG